MKKKSFYVVDKILEQNKKYTIPILNSSTSSIKTSINKSNTIKQLQFNYFKKYLSSSYPSYGGAAIKYNGNLQFFGNSLNNSYHSSQSNSPSSNTGNIIQVSLGEKSGCLLNSDGTVETWGPLTKQLVDDATFDTSNLDLTNVKKILMTKEQGIALKKNGTVVFWGKYPDSNGCIGYHYWLQRKAGGTFWNCKTDITDYILPLLTNIKDIYNNWTSFAVLKNDGTAIFWGDPRTGGVPNYNGRTGVFVGETKIGKLTIGGSGKTGISLTQILENSATEITPITNGYDTRDVMCTGTQCPKTIGGQISGVKQISFSGGYMKSYGLVKNDGTLVTWGWEDYGGNTSWMDDKYKKHTDIVFMGKEGRLLTKNKDIITWTTQDTLVEHTWWGNEDKNDLQIFDITHNFNNFAVLKSNNTVYVNKFGDINLLTDIIEIAFYSDNSFGALKNNGILYFWNDFSIDEFIEIKDIGIETIIQPTTTTTNSPTTTTTIKDPGYISDDDDVCGNITEDGTFYLNKNLDWMEYDDSNFFNVCENFKKLVIGESVTIIGESSIYGCKDLTIVDMSNATNLIYIISWVFSNCENLEKVIVSKSVTYISSDAFENCNALNYIEFPTKLYTLNKQYQFWPNNLQYYKDCGNGMSILSTSSTNCPTKPVTTTTTNTENIIDFTLFTRNKHLEVCADFDNDVEIQILGSMDKEKWYSYNISDDDNIKRLIIKPIYIPEKEKYCVSFLIENFKIKNHVLSYITIKNKGQINNKQYIVQRFRFLQLEINTETNTNLSKLYYNTYTSGIQLDPTHLYQFKNSII